MVLVKGKEEFMSRLVEGLRGAFPEAEVKVGNVRKNNGIDLTAVSIFKPGEHISPNIYIDSFYLDYMSGKTTIDEVVSAIIDAYEHTDVPELYDMESLGDFKSVKDRIECSLINSESNEELLKTIPHIDFLDLAIVFRIRVDYRAPSSITVASVLVTNSQFSEFGVSLDTLKEVAIENIKRTGIEFMPMMESICKKLLEDSHFSDFSDLNNLLGVEEVPDIPMYILTNPNKMRGAGTVLFALDEVGEKVGRKQFYVIPSSLHEVIIYTGDEDVEYVKYLIEDVNRNAVTKEDFLSNNLYYYDGKNLKIVE